MKRIVGIGILGLAIGVQASPVVFYGGDFNGITGLPSQINGNNFTDRQVYDDFTLTHATQIDSLFGNFLDTGSVRGGSLVWEIRKGVGDNNPGTLLFSGNTTATAVRSNTTYTNIEYTYSCNVSPIVLSPGNYFVSLAVDGGNGDIYVSTTGGTNGVGGPFDNDNSFYNAPSIFVYYSPASNYVGSTADFSFGLRGVPPTPEPASMVALGLGALALLRRRRK